MFGLSKRELEAKFKKSEMVILAWRSQETAYLMEQSTKEYGTPQQGSRGKWQAGVPAGLPDHFFRKTYDPETGLGPGELDLRQVTGDEAFKFFQAQGIRLPIMARTN